MARRKPLDWMMVGIVIGAGILGALRAKALLPAPESPPPPPPQPPQGVYNWHAATLYLPGDRVWYEGATYRAGRPPAGVPPSMANSGPAVGPDGRTCWEVYWFQDGDR